MTISLAASATALPPSAGAGPAGASQNLFEHMANTAKGMPEGASPHQIGSGLMERLNSFIDRSRTFSERADLLTNNPSAPPQVAAADIRTSGASPTAEPGKKVAEQQVDQIVHSLGKMFDYSIETQMVVRGATQISGSANTLLKGQ
ncbi:MULTISPECIES: hypothetical protein [Pseudomonas]|jgi:hypothetical protein|uniref:hypothetical protein n=1 Tax=Pseudomonas TaxID=286 RepID=UPI000272C1C6|nr:MULTISPECIES: hypothetical protein [Pseudomonas]MDP9061244.1 hypothetical protein [Pseudomonadota bacterium]AUO24352.1 hypothetical protein C0058_21060 [Pseudomonas sp. NC02]EJF72264.1 hypothetical protein A462_09462 [Pseudomonas sp. Ag1]MBT1264535.1 hypothetical protein [Pseudomonas sp. VS38]MDE1913805.1 hypothetical protein [Pseudomonas sp.]